MTHTTYATINDQGRLVVPAPVRAVLGVHGGETLQFVIEEGSVRLLTPRMAAMAVWAQNEGGDNCDAGDIARSLRSRDQQVDAASWRRVDTEQDSDKTVEDLLAELTA